MTIDKKILNEIERYRSINQYITEQAAPEPTELDALMAPAPGEIAPPPAPGGEVPALKWQNLRLLMLLMTLMLKRLTKRVNLKKKLKLKKVELKNLM
jgi:3-oxoacyl-ACP reductase-like protein